MNTDIMKIWIMITSSYICRHKHCKDCHKMYDNDGCPEDYANIDTNKVMDFISKMTDLLRLKDEEMPFDLDISDEDFINLLEEATTVDKQGLEPYQMPEI